MRHSNAPTETDNKRLASRIVTWVQGHNHKSDTLKPCRDDYESWFDEVEKRIEQPHAWNFATEKMVQEIFRELLKMIRQIHSDLGNAATNADGTQEVLHRQ